MILDDGHNFYLTFYLLHIFKKLILQNLVESPFSSTVYNKFSRSTGDGWNLLYNKKVLIIYQETNNNYLHVCCHEPIFVI